MTHDHLLSVKPKDKTFKPYIDDNDTSKTSQATLIWKSVILEFLFKFYIISIKEISCSHEKGICNIAIALQVFKEKQLQ